MHELSQRLARVRRSLGQLQKKLDALDDHLKLGADGAILAAETLASLDADLGELDDLGALGRELLEAVEHARGQLESHLKGAAARLAGAVAARLGDAGLPRLDGHLPELRCGVLTLEFALDGRRKEVRLVYGPSGPVLARVPPEPKAIAEAVQVALRELDTPAELDELAWLGQLATAYDRLCAARGGGAGWAAPIIELMAELAFVQQSERFRLDPIETHYSAYGRTRFSYDLGRLRHTVHDGRKLVLGVATRQQTRSRAEHLWVPRGPSGKGTHYATVALLETDDG